MIQVWRTSVAAARSTLVRMAKDRKVILIWNGKADVLVQELPPRPDRYKKVFSGDLPYTRNQTL